MKAICLTLLLALAPFAATAQDTRRVPEPRIPPTCGTLKSAIARAGLSIMFEDEGKLDTARIQAAMDACPAGQAVVLQRSSPRLDAFLSGPLHLRKGVTLVVAKDTWLFASRNPRDYDRRPGVCGTITQEGHGCLGLINGDGVADAGVMGDGVIDGRGGEAILGQSLTWWNLADQARKGGSQNNPRLMVLNGCDNFTLYRITLMNSPNFHVGYNNGNGFTAWGVKIWCPERARNTDGIDPGNSTNVTITRCYLHTGDDQVAIKAPEGKPTTHMSIVHNHFYTGHGMSIGSTTDGGASAIRVRDLSIEGSDNGLRIKSNPTRGGLVHDVVFEDVCIRATANPVFMDTSYSAHVSQATNRLPEFRDITLRGVRVEGGGRVSAKHADIAAGPGPFGLRIAGEGVKVTGTPGTAPPNACTGKFVPFPMP